MEAFNQCVALGPVAIYLLLLGVIGLARRPIVMSGGRDATALALAVSGMILVGPLALFFPESLAAHMGPSGRWYVWSMLTSLIVLCVAFMLLNLRPRLVIYNITVARLRPILAEIVQRLDPEARWAGDSIFLPGLGVQFHLDAVGWMRNVSLVSSGPKQDHLGWMRLRKELTAALRGVDSPWSFGGLLLLSAGNVLVIWLALVIVRDPQAIMRTVHELLNWQ
jgi:hypothetical protein